MRRVWADANLIIRLLTNDPPNMATRAAHFMDRAASGEFRLMITPLVVAECFWVLTRFYRQQKGEVVDALQAVCLQAGTELLERAVTQTTLTLMAQKNVDFVDAYLAAHALTAGEAVASFDRDHRKLGVLIEEIS